MIIDYKELPFIRQEVNSEPLILKTGVFDLLHPGHIQMLEFIHALNGVSVVGIAPDSRVKQRKGPGRPIQGQFQRAGAIEQTGLVDYVFTLPEGITGVARAILRLRPEIFVDHKSDIRAPNLAKATLQLAGVKHVLLEEPRITSTTEIVAKQAYSLERSV